MPKGRGQGDRELAALSTIMKSLEGLDGDSIQRVLDYVLGRLSVNRSPLTKTGSLSYGIWNPPPSGEATGHLKSIRDLKEEKNPESANQMVALVAYYLSELAPEAERRSTISVDDVSKYFKQAAFRLPKSIRQALHNATAAGYLNPAGRGKFGLNPVGYNLVVHGLPRSEASPTKGAGKSKRKPNR